MHYFDTLRYAMRVLHSAGQTQCRLQHLSILSSDYMLWLCAGQQFDVFVSGPQVDCSIDPVSGEVHITQVLQVHTPCKLLAHMYQYTHCCEQLLV